MVSHLVAARFAGSRYARSTSARPGIERNIMHRERIKSAYADLSPSYQRLADFLMDHPYEAAFMTATQLGKQLEVDTATVVRFAQKLGYHGYPDLLGEVQAEVRERFARYSQPVGPGEKAADVFRASIRQDVINIEQFDLGLDD